MPNIEQIKIYILTKKDTGEKYIMTEKVFAKVSDELGSQALEEKCHIEVILASSKLNRSLQ